jgi:hypothetical protein
MEKKYLVVDYSIEPDLLRMARVFSCPWHNEFNINNYEIHANARSLVGLITKDESQQIILSEIQSVGKKFGTKIAIANLEMNDEVFIFNLDQIFAIEQGFGKKKTLPFDMRFLEELIKNARDDFDFIPAKKNEWGFVLLFTGTIFKHKQTEKLYYQELSTDSVYNPSFSWVWKFVELE